MKHEVDAATVSLADGSVAHVVSLDDGWALEIDGIRQSHVGDDAAPGLAVTRWMTTVAGPGTPMRVAHLGGGMLSLPRALSHVRPGSTHLVIELEQSLVDFAVANDAVPSGTEITVADARAWLDAASGERFDLICIDVYAGGRIPPQFTTLECFSRASALLAEGGMLLVNSVAGPEQAFTSGQLATMQSVFAHVALIVQGSALGGLRFGNAILIGSHVPIDADAIRNRLRGDPSKGALVTDLDEIIGDCTPVTDADAVWSPEPDLPDARGALASIEALRTMAESTANILRNGGRSSETSPE